MVDKVFVVSLRSSILALKSSSNLDFQAHTRTQTHCQHTKLQPRSCTRSADDVQHAMCAPIHSTQQPALSILHQDSPGFCNSSISSKSILSIIQIGPTHHPHILLDKRLNLVEVLFNAPTAHNTEREREMQSNERREKGRRCGSTAPV